MEINIDADLCTGHARCVALAPEAFTFDDVTARGGVRLLGDVPARLQDRVARAVRSCPERAISFTDPGQESLS